MKRYELVVRTDEDNLTLLIDATKSLGDIVSMTQIPEPRGKSVARATPAARSEAPAQNGAHPPANRYVGGMRFKGITGRQLMNDILADDKAHSRKSMQKAFVKRKFSPKTVSPIITEMTQKNTIVTTKPGYYRRATERDARPQQSE